jgi:two-component system, chemotaxis family, chemotaxis protein CheY
MRGFGVVRASENGDGRGRNEACNKPRRVLVVDDDPAIRSVLAVGLRLAGMAVIEAEDGARGLGRALRSRPDLVVTDVKMPVLDGFGLAAALREDERTYSIPIVFVSGETEPALRERAEAAGAAAFFTKPFDPIALAERVGELLTRGRTDVASVPRAPRRVAKVALAAGERGRA